MVSCEFDLSFLKGWCAQEQSLNEALAKGRKRANKNQTGAAELYVRVLSFFITDVRSKDEMLTLNNSALHQKY